METQTKIWVAVSVGVALLALAVVIMKPGTIVEKVTETLGGIPGSELDGNAWSVGGVQHFYKKQALLFATSTPCALKSPAATSTLVHASVNFRTSSTTVVTIAKSATQYATTTLIGSSVAVSEGTQPVIVATTTAAQEAVATRTFAPNTFVVISQTDTAAITLIGPTGVCRAEWIVL